MAMRRRFRRKDELAYVKDNQVWTAPLAADSKQEPKRLLFDRGKDGDLHWSPDGKRLAFVSNRDDHAFIARVHRRPHADRIPVALDRQ